MSKQEKICDYVIHPAASVFPLIEGDAFQRLVDSIAVHGVQNPIVSHKGQVLDGRNRLRAVMKLRDEGQKVELPCVEWDSPNGMTEAEWIEAQNLDRRHLSPDAFAAAAAALSRIFRKEAKDRQKAGLKKGTEKPVSTKRSTPGKRDTKARDAASTAGQVSQKAGVSLRKAKQAVALDKAVEAGTVPESVQKDVIAGKTKLKDAVAKIPATSKSKPASQKRKYESIEDEIRVDINNAWSRLKGKYAIHEHKLLRQKLVELIRSEQRRFDKASNPAGWTTAATLAAAK